MFWRQESEDFWLQTPEHVHAREGVWGHVLGFSQDKWEQNSGRGEGVAFQVTGLFFPLWVEDELGLHKAEKGY